MISFSFHIGLEFCLQDAISFDIRLASCLHENILLHPVGGLASVLPPLWSHVSFRFSSGINFGAKSDKPWRITHCIIELLLVNQRP